MLTIITSLEKYFPDFMKTWFSGIVIYDPYFFPYFPRSKKQAD
jgi:hypothetical protein